MELQKAAPYPACQKLLAYIRENHDSLPAFAEASGLDRVRIQKAIRGEFERMNVSFAFEIQAATGGAVTAEMFAEAARKIEAKRRREERKTGS